MSGAPPALRVGVVGYGLMGKLCEKPLALTYADAAAAGARPVSDGLPPSYRHRPGG